MLSLYSRSLLARLLVSILALVLAALLLTSAAALYLLPSGSIDPLATVVFLSLAVVILVAIGADVFLLARNISSPMRELAHAARVIGEGRLDMPITVQREDEIGALADDLRHMQTQLARAQESLRQEKVRYAELNELKDRLLANVPHEIKTPLAAIAASLEMLEDQALDLSVSDQQRLLGSIHRSVVRLEYLIDNMLDAASIQAGQFSVRPEPTLLAPVLEQARAFVQPLLEQNAQQAVIEDCTSGRYVSADPIRISQVMINLLSNALKYSERPGIIYVRASCEDHMVRVLVHNRGAAIALEDQAGLFNRFSRAARDGQVSGIGLGLAIAKTIVEFHGGEVGLNSLPEHGTTFWFTLPLSQEVLNEGFDC